MYCLSRLVVPSKPWNPFCIFTLCNIYHLSLKPLSLTLPRLSPWKLTRSGTASKACFQHLNITGDLQAIQANNSTGGIGPIKIFSYASVCTYYESSSVFHIPVYPKYATLCSPGGSVLFQICTSFWNSLSPSFSAQLRQTQFPPLYKDSVIDAYHERGLGMRWLASKSPDLRERKFCSCNRDQAPTRASVTKQSLVSLVPENLSELGNCMDVPASPVILKFSWTDRQFPVLCSHQGVCTWHAVEFHFAGLAIFELMSWACEVNGVVHAPMLLLFFNIWKFQASQTQSNGKEIRSDWIVLSCRCSTETPSVVICVTST